MTSGKICHITEAKNNFPGQGKIFLMINEFSMLKAGIFFTLAQAVNQWYNGIMS